MRISAKRFPVWTVIMTYMEPKRDCLISRLPQVQRKEQEIMVWQSVPRGRRTPPVIHLPIRTGRRQMHESSKAKMRLRSRQRRLQHGTKRNLRRRNAKRPMQLMNFSAVCDSNVETE